MSDMSTGGRRGIAAAALLAALLTGTACGTQTGVVTDLDGALPGSAPSASPQGQSEKATDADARRAARGQLPEPSEPAARRRVPDALP